MDDINDSFLNGIFVNELKNRFLCNVSINGKETICYIPSSCRLSNFIDLSGREVILRPVSASNARTQYAVYAVRIKQSYVLLYLSEANRIIEKQLFRRYFSFLGARRRVRREYKIGTYKADLFIEESRTVIEIKSILSFSRQAYFPNIYSERAIQQLKKISELLDNGYRVCYLFVSMNPYVKAIKIDASMTDFYNLFVECVSKGMQICAFSVKLIGDVPELHSKIKIIL